MSKTSYCAVLIGIAILSLACGSSETTTEQKPNNPSIATSTPKGPPPKDGIRRMTVAELQGLVQKGEAFIVDVRNDAQYKKGHIKGARLIPTDQILQRAEELPRDKTIVTYCSWPAEQTSAGAAVNLRSKGINNTAALLGGYEAWVDAGLPIETK